MATTVPNPAHAPTALDVALDTLRDPAGCTLRGLSELRPTLVCLLRHSGCTFCRETLAELAKQRQQIERNGVGIAVVGMSADVESMIAMGRRFGLEGVAYVADPDRLLYQALHVKRGSLLQLMGPAVIVAGLRGLFRGYGFAFPRQDPFQMPGTAVVHRGRVVRQYVHRSAADRPEFAQLACSLENS